MSSRRILEGGRPPAPRRAACPALSIGRGARSVRPGRPPSTDCEYHSPLISPEHLSTAEYTLLAEMHHTSLAEFVIEYFIRRRSWVVWVHHAMSLATIIAVALVIDAQDTPFFVGLFAFV